MRFRQSYAKVLLTETAEDLRHQLDHGRVATRAMNGGSLLDYLVFGLDHKYEVIDARYQSGPRAGKTCTDWTGKEAQQQAESCRSRDVLPVLEAELDALRDVATRINARLKSLIGERKGHFQQHVAWTSAIGTACEGTPDVIVVGQSGSTSTWTVETVDLKRTDVSRRRFGRQVHEMCWDVQAAAYEEAALSFVRERVDEDEPIVYQGHTIIAAEPAGRMRVLAYPLSKVYLAIGQRRWQKAQRMWVQCCESGEWPGYSEEPIEPSHYLVRTELEQYGFGGDAEPEEP